MGIDHSLGHLVQDDKDDVGTSAWLRQGQATREDAGGGSDGTRS